MVAQADGYTFTMTNVSVVGPFKVMHNDAGAAAGNRIICPNSLDFDVPYGGSVIFTYDATYFTRWTIVGRSI